MTPVWPPGDPRIRSPLAAPLSPEPFGSVVRVAPGVGLTTDALLGPRCMVCIRGIALDPDRERAHSGAIRLRVNGKFCGTFDARHVADVQEGVLRRYVESYEKPHPPECSLRLRPPVILEHDDVLVVDYARDVLLYVLAAVDDPR